jgi:hypothetical protein
MTRKPVRTTASDIRDSWLVWLGVIGVSLLMTVLFWEPLWKGATLIGGDTFSYYFPQKTFLADSLKRGEFPLWNPLVGAGYPIAAESQTGVLYPPMLVAYRFLDVHLAYSAIQLFHYTLAFAGMWAVARQYGISRLGALLAGLVYVYGWFPTRICLEWAIIGGAYLPWCVWLVEGWLTTDRRRTLLWLAPVFGMFLLAGHFHLAFITTLALVVYVCARLMLRSRESSTPAEPRTRLGQLGWFIGVLVTGYLIAAVQLGPTLELMTRSQRQEFNQGNDPGYGHIPPWYLTQVFSSWIWYLPGSDPDQALFNVGSFAYPCSTNKVEAHLYFGMAPLLLILGAGLWGLSRREWPWSRPITIWMGIGLIGVLIATGWPFVILKHLPGFGYFRGAGRYGILTSFAAALCAGAACDVWMPALRPDSRVGLARRGMRWCGWLLIFSLTAWDLYLVSRWVTYAFMVDHPIVEMRETSEIREVLRQSTRPVRLWSRGSNAATIEGYSAFPVYLGLGPREYFEEGLASGFKEDEQTSDPVAVSKQVDWLRRNGVTHILSFVPLDETLWKATLRYRGGDQLLSRVWARSDSPFYLYECVDAPGRVVDSQGNRLEVEQFEQSANRVALTTSPTVDTRVVVRELAYPGWRVTVDGVEAPSQVVDTMYRGVDVKAGKHQIAWSYYPRSLVAGLIMSGLALLGWLVVLRRSGRSLDPGDRHAIR